jgi:peptide-N4-(N-acetyl-beta-glucosaminyl)asparagine amidase
MDADELLARSLQEEEDRAAAAELLRREASANAVTSHREDFARRLDGGVRTVLAYENAEARAAALAVIPVARLKREADALVARAAERAAENERGSARADDGSVRVREISRRDALLLRLLRWFKREFFEWCDAPACLACGCADAPRPTGPGVPTPEEAKHGASRVETYACASATCGKAIRFPRFNDATKLLQTRVGRCGEWANCFALCCRALEFETRWVLDWTDHVWVEVYSDTQERWLHCDACEDACDAPKMYERGWGKKLSFVVAFGKDDVVDVTRRYVLDFEGETLGRRALILPDPQGRGLAQRRHRNAKGRAAV